jgi:hypothetical protein
MTKPPKGWDKIVPRQRKRAVRGGKRASPPGTRRLLVTETTHEAILELIESWPLTEELSWGTFMADVRVRYGGEWTRQAVAKHEDLQEAFTKRQKKIRDFRRAKAQNTGRRVARTRDEEVAYLKKQVELLNRENADLKQQSVVLHARLNRWRHNAFLHRVTPHQLDAPMQENDRGRSDKR